MTAKKEPDPTHALFVDELVKVYEQVHGAKYLFAGGKDGMALKRLLTIATREEILAVWAKGLTTDKEFDRVHNLAELAGKWTRLVAKPAQNPNVYREPAPVSSSEPKDAPFGKCSKCEAGAWSMIHDEAGNFNPMCARCGA